MQIVEGFKAIQSHYKSNIVNFLRVYAFLDTFKKEKKGISIIGTFFYAIVIVKAINTFILGHEI